MGDGAPDGATNGSGSAESAGSRGLEGVGVGGSKLAQLLSQSQSQAQHHTNTNTNTRCQEKQPQPQPGQPYQHQDAQEKQQQQQHSLQSYLEHLASRRQPQQQPQKQRMMMSRSVTHSARQPSTAGFRSLKNQQFSRSMSIAHNANTTSTKIPPHSKPHAFDPSVQRPKSSPALNIHSSPIRNSHAMKGTHDSNLLHVNIISNNNYEEEEGSVLETQTLVRDVDPITGQKMINQYRIIHEIGRGVHGKVKLALDTETQELWAIKIVEKTARRRFQSRYTMSHSLSKKSASESTSLPIIIPTPHTSFQSSSNPYASASVSSLSLPSSHSIHQAVKHVPPPIHNPHLEKIKREIAILKKLNHPHIVKLREVIDDEQADKIYLVLEYLDGGDIRWRDRSDPPKPVLSESDARLIFRDVVSGLEYLHYQGIVHRDIKPANLLWTSCHRVKISDFGVSLFVGTESSMDRDGNNDQCDGDLHIADELELAKTAGSPAFFAPELCSVDIPLPNLPSSSSFSSINQEQQQTQQHLQPPPPPLPNLRKPSLAFGFNGGRISDPNLSSSLTEPTSVSSLSSSTHSLSSSFKTGSGDDGAGAGGEYDARRSALARIRHRRAMSRSRSRSRGRWGGDAQGQSFKNSDGKKHDEEEQNQQQEEQNGIETMHVKVYDGRRDRCGRFGFEEREEDRGDDEEEEQEERVSPISIGAAIDIWALGVTLYCLVFGRVPFIADNEWELFRVICKSPLSFPDEPSISDRLKDLLYRLLDKNPDSRILLQDIKNHPWTTEDMSHTQRLHWLGPLNPTIQYGIPLSVTEEEVSTAVKRRLVLFERIRDSLKKFGVRLGTLFLGRKMKRRDGGGGGDRDDNGGGRGKDEQQERYLQEDESVFCMNDIGHDDTMDVDKELPLPPTS